MNIDISTFIDFANFEYSKIAFVTVKKNVSRIPNNFNGPFTRFTYFENN